MPQLSISMADFLGVLRSYSSSDQRTGRASGRRAAHRNGDSGHVVLDGHRQEVAATGRPVAAPRIVTIR
jgi:hypothetical protein